MNKKYILLSFLLTLFIFSWSVKAQECVEPYENIFINSDTVLCPGTYNLDDTDTNGAIIINASDVILDCNGAVLNGNRIGGSAGISNGYLHLVSKSVTNGHNNVTVKNCIIQKYFIGLFWINATNGSINNNTVNNSVRTGIQSYYSSNNAFIDNKVFNTYGSASFGGSVFRALTGFLIEYSDHITLIDNIAINNVEYGIFIYKSEYATLINNAAVDNENGIVTLIINNTILANNTANENIYAGFVIIESNYIDLYDNEAINNMADIGVQANHTKIISNRVSQSYMGIGLISGTSNTSLLGAIIKNITESANITHNPHSPKYCSNITIINNTANLTNILPGYYPSGYGLGLEDCNDVILSGNKADYNELTGIVLLESNNNIIENNDISNNDGYGGILIQSSNNNSVIDNNLIDNTYGVYSEYSNYNTFNYNEFLDNTYDGVKLDTTDSNNITLNNISINHVGIRIIDSSNFNIINNTLTNNEQADILIDPSNDFRIIENEISNSVSGIKLVETTNSNISKNIIEFNNIGVNITDSSNFNIINNTFRNNTQVNVVIDPSNDFKLIDNLIIFSNYGLKILDSLGGIILRNLIQYNNYGIYIDSSNIVTNDTIISDSVYYDIWLENSNNTLTNTTFDGQKVNITGPSTMPVIWYLDIRVLDQDQNPLESASVVGYDNNNIEVFSLSTDANGYISAQELIEYIQNSTEKIFYSPYTIQVEKEDFITSILVFNLTESTTLNITLSSTVVPSNVDIDPNTINLKSKGQFVMAFIEVPGHNVSNIDINTVRMNETIPAINDTKYGFVKDPKIEDRDDDGLLEFMAVFDRDLVKTILQVGDNALTVTGEIEDTSFEESDTITAK